MCFRVRTCLSKFQVRIYADIVAWGFLTTGANNFKHFLHRAFKKLLLN